MGDGMIEINVREYMKRYILLDFIFNAGKLEINRTGVTRTVILSRKYVLKIPTTKTYELFLSGLKANLQERTFGNLYQFPCLNATLASSKYGLFTVQKRLKPVDYTLPQFNLDMQTLMNRTTIRAIHESDWKPENYGYDGLELKRIDYG